MAKKEDTPKIILERTYNVPLRKEFSKVADWRRTEKAVKALRQFVAKHMKSNDVKLGRYVNKDLWKHGIKNPPHHVKISAKKDDKGRVVVELAEFPARAKREIEKQEIAKNVPKKEETKKIEGEKKAIGGKEQGNVVEAEFKEEKREKEEKAKEIEKEEIKELRKKQPRGNKPHGKIPQPKQPVDQRATAPKSV